MNGFDEVYSFGAYEGVLRKLIHVFKFEGVRTLQRPLGALLSRALPRESSFDAVVPMPLHWRRRWQRGFNQSELLAREIGRRWNVPLCRLVRRQRATAPQAGLTSAERRKNVLGAFAVKNTARLNGMRLLLVDDVLTTGATASACARALKRAGAAHADFSCFGSARPCRRIFEGHRRRYCQRGELICMIGTSQERLHRPVLVLNSSYEPINVCAARRALVLVIKGDAAAEEQAPARYSCASCHPRSQRDPSS